MTMSMKRLLAWIKIRGGAGWLAAAMAMLATGCSTFHREWREFEVRKFPESEMTGRWEGGWLSKKNGHRGKLRCVMTPAGDDRYRAHFHATYWKIFRYRYPVELKVETSAGVARFSGSARLGALAGGEYHYEGEARGGVFEARYRSKYDHGTFTMKLR